MSLRLTNTLTGGIEEFKPLSGTVGIYTCGMTVQDQPHVGHMRAYVTSDVLRRYLEFCGHKVMALQNVTDIDDKIIARSQEEKTDYRVIAERYHQEYLDVADRMNILRPAVFPRATQHIQEMIALIERLVTKGVAYSAGGDVYFEVAKFPDYCKLSKKKVEDLISGHRVALGELKRSPADFALWKAAKPGEPYWHSPWGKGRPGWHIECSAMAIHYLGETFDIHMGGEDTIFPHHENEIAQSEAATGKPFARFWIHNAHLNLTGEKMSKSTRHFYAARDILDKYSANAVRLYFLKAHYRSPIEFSCERLDEAEAAWIRITNFLKRATGTDAKPDFAPFKAAMDDDLNTPQTLGLIFDAVAAGDAARVQGYLAALGFTTETKRVTSVQLHSEAGIKGTLTISQSPGKVQRLLEALLAADSMGETGIAKSIAEGLEGMGFVVTQGPSGTSITRKPGVPDDAPITPSLRLLEARTSIRTHGGQRFRVADLIRAGLDDLGYLIEDTPQGARLIPKEK